MPPKILLALTGLLASTTLAPAAEPPSFREVGVAFLEKHCLVCHGDKVKKADLALHTFRDDGAILKERKRWLTVLQLVESGEMPPRSKPRPAAADVAAFLAAVNGVFDRADRNAPPDPGRVTVRRLNRTEYNNTIRDLVGVDFHPAEDFPSDDVGHGFDNIGDVLTLPPVLLERYLAAAESIVQRAIVAVPPSPPVRRQAARWLEPAQPADLRWRPLAGKGNLNTPWRLTLDGEYFFRARVYATTPDQEPVRVALLADGKELKTFEVRGSDKKSEVIEAKVTLPVGDCRIAVALLNPSESEPKRTLYVEYLELTGPTDTRPASQRRLLDLPPNTPKEARTRIVLARFASRAYRRPATADEVNRLVKLVETAEARGERWEAGIQLALQAVLVSPKFLFRLELDDGRNRPGPVPLDDYQLASRLSYFLWASMPDDELFALAEKKALAANLDAQVRRMLADPKARSLVDNFALQWLQLGRLQNFAPDAKLFPNFDERLRASMLRETTLFLMNLIQEDRSVLDLLDADYTFLDERLARHYGITDTNGTHVGKKPTRPGGRPIRGREFQRVSLADGERGGLLTMASVLAVTSNPTRTSPVKRGKWVLEQLLGAPPPPPPPNVPELAEGEKAALTGTLRQRMEQHRANPTCANCHDKMDALGFAFENFDAVGAFRTHDAGARVDPSGTLPDGRSFQGPAELKALLKGEKAKFARCLAEKMLTYAVGRGLEYYDRRAVNRIVVGLERDGYRFSALVAEVVKSDPFRLKRGTRD